MLKTKRNPIKYQPWEDPDAGFFHPQLLFKHPLGHYRIVARLEALPQVHPNSTVVYAFQEPTRCGKGWRATANARTMNEATFFAKLWHVRSTNPQYAGRAGKVPPEELRKVHLPDDLFSLSMLMPQKSEAHLFVEQTAAEWREMAAAMSDQRRRHEQHRETQSA